MPEADSPAKNGISTRASTSLLDVTQGRDLKWACGGNTIEKLSKSARHFHFWGRQTINRDPSRRSGTSGGIAVEGLGLCYLNRPWKPKFINGLLDTKNEIMPNAGLWLLSSCSLVRGNRFKTVYIYFCILFFYFFTLVFLGSFFYQRTNEEYKNKMTKFIGNSCLTCTQKIHHQIGKWKKKYKWFFFCLILF